MITKPIDTPAETDETEAARTGAPRTERAPVPAQNDAPGELSLPAGQRHFWRWVFVVGVAAGAWFSHQRWLPIIAPGLAKGSAVAAKSGPKLIPVRTAVVQQRDMPVLISGLGTVTAFKTVTLRSRVDGELIKVAFTEGQMVREGELLAEIDPRLFQSQLQQAEGTLAKDEATLKLAKITLARGEDLLRTKNIAPQQVDEEASQVQTIEGTVQTDRAMVANAKLQ